MKISLFMTNYNREVRIEVDIKKNEKMEKMKKIQEEAEVALRKTQEEMKWQADKRRKEIKV